MTWTIFIFVVVGYGIITSVALYRIQELSEEVHQWRTRFEDERTAHLETLRGKSPAGRRFRVVQGGHDD